MGAAIDIIRGSLDSGYLPVDFEGRDEARRPEVAIKIRRLRKSYGHIEAVRGIDLEITRGEIFGIIGPDGAGKTSVFQVLGGVMDATEGEALVFGRASRQVREKIGYLTQAFSLYQDLSVAENL
ncbi:MAG TPA: ATP-binding cassette domain-containing protein, partial [Blastocatellia bacterium]|nr:ATP-binding cassette domain-containing protein [Blastocatellia bacterium]